MSQEPGISAKPDADAREREMRLFILVNQALRFSDGALAAAAAQATWLTLRKACETDPQRLHAYDAHVQPKISLRVKNGDHLTKAQGKAADAGIPFADVIVPLANPGDGLRHGIAGIGPACRAELPSYIRNLQVLAQDPAADAETVAAPEPPEGEAMWLLVRRDLGLSQGKLSAQAGHACWTAGGIALAWDKGSVERWEEAGCPVGVIWLPNVDTMARIHHAASGSGLPSAFIIDAGRTEIEPGTPTVLGIGPCGADALPLAARHLLGREAAYAPVVR